MSDVESDREQAEHARGDDTRATGRTVANLATASRIAHGERGNCGAAPSGLRGSGPAGRFPLGPEPARAWPAQGAAEDADQRRSQR